MLCTLTSNRKSIDYCFRSSSFDPSGQWKAVPYYELTKGTKIETSMSISNGKFTCTVSGAYKFEVGASKVRFAHIL